MDELVTMPFAWNQNQCTGINWLQGFMDWVEELFIKYPDPEMISMNRASSFNCTIVGFY